MNFTAMTANWMLSRHLSDVWETGLVDFHLVNSGGGGWGEEDKGGGGEIGGEKEEEEGERKGKEKEEGEGKGEEGEEESNDANKVPFA